MTFAERAALALVVPLLVLGATDGAGQSLTPSEWLSLYTCDNRTSPKPEASWRRFWLGHACDREPASWRWKYVDELNPAFQVLVHERTIDERLANILDLVDAYRPLPPISMRFDRDERPEEVERLKRRLAGSRVDDELCAIQLRQMAELTDEMGARLKALRRDITQPGLEERHIRLARVLDSFGRYDAGFLSGSVYSTGAYDQCTKSQLVLASGADKRQQVGRVQMRFCWAKLKLNRHLDKSLQARSRSYLEMADKVIATGICVPQSCHTRALERNTHLVRRLVDLEFKFPKSIYVDENNELESVYCLPDPDSEHMRVSFAGWLCLALAVVWFALLFAATLVTRRRLSSARNQEPHVQSEALAGPSSVLATLDLVSSWGDLVASTDVKYLNSRVDLNALNGVKVFMAAAVALAHASVLDFGISKNFVQAMVEFDTDYLNLAMRANFLIMDSFFVISGLLTGYIGTRTVRKVFCKPKPTDERPKLTTDLAQLAQVWLNITARRLVRLGPLLVTCYWFRRALFKHLGSGPLWDPGTSGTSAEGHCYKSGWLSANALACIPHAWYIFNDLYLVVLFVPPVVYLLATGRTRLVYVACACISALSVLAALVDYHSVEPSKLHLFRELTIYGFMVNIFGVGRLYVHPFYRVDRVYIGLVAGYALYRYSENQNKSHVWPWWMRGPATWLSLAVVLVFAGSAAFLQEIKLLLGETYKLLPVYQLTIIPVVWGLANAIIFLRMTTDWRRKYLVRIGSSTFMNALSNLSLSVYLVHLLFLLHLVYARTSAVDFSKWSYYSSFAATYFMTVPVSTVLFVCIENPANKLLRRLIAIR